MTVNLTYVSPVSATLDLANGALVNETHWDAIASDLYVLGGTDGLSHTGKYQIGSTQTYSNANNTAGLNINQGAADDEILSLKSSDVAHGVTTTTETDTYALLKKQSAASGGLDVIGLSEVAGSGIRVYGIQTGDDTAKSTSAGAAVTIIASTKSGTAPAAVGANGNVAVFSNNGTVRHILDGDGDSHQDVGTAWTNFDVHDDLALLDGAAALLGGPDRLRKFFTETFLAGQRALLERERIVTFNDDGHHFVNWSRFHMLHMGATRFLGDRLTDTTAELTARLARLEAHPALTV